MSNEQYYPEVYEDLRGIASSEQWELDFSATDYQHWERAESETLEGNVQAHSRHCNDIVERQRKLADDMAIHCSNNAVLFKKVMVYEHILKAAAARIQFLENANDDIWVQIEALRAEEHQILIKKFVSWFVSRLSSSVKSTEFVESFSMLLSQKFTETSTSVTVDSFEMQEHEWRGELVTKWEALKTKSTRREGSFSSPAAPSGKAEEQ
ncbi:hypothetical protein EXIGLDRAFT_782901 [Exidia glandulosa HHB12029]|uniref:Uncharacterized protein n=1 Tax=Exidia glandulosa HHB12029 TaxID=1314781 RepID=A0A165Z171_EXIGL|nr:hypothetical protein EXIGLDRAFT_783791 [Exidia glandulosa HHB12029]KZV79036.1 hypothetical protein EXIGLDRAFT_782901 [Exidia glandulosa HHB12029]